jgi:hypothetical protein
MVQGRPGSDGEGDDVRSGLPWLGTVILAMSMAACQQRDDVADGFPDGMCVSFTSSADGLDQQIGSSACSGPHTHVVVGWVGQNATCPTGSDAEFGTPDGKLCLRADPGPSPRPGTSPSS